MQLEFEMLSKVTGDKVFAEKVCLNNNIILDIHVNKGMCLCLCMPCIDIFGVEMITRFFDPFLCICFGSRRLK